MKKGKSKIATIGTATLTRLDGRVTELMIEAIVGPQVRIQLK